MSAAPRRSSALTHITWRAGPPGRPRSGAPPGLERPPAGRRAGAGPGAPGRALGTLAQPREPNRASRRLGCSLTFPTILAFLRRSEEHTSDLQSRQYLV